MGSGTGVAYFLVHLWLLWHLKGNEEQLVQMLPGHLTEWLPSLCQCACQPKQLRQKILQGGLQQGSPQISECRSNRSAASLIKAEG